MRAPLTSAETLAHSADLLRTLGFVLDWVLRDACPPGAAPDAWARTLPPAESLEAWWVRRLSEPPVDDPTWPVRRLRAELQEEGFSGGWPAWRSPAAAAAPRPVAVPAR